MFTLPCCKTFHQGTKAETESGQYKPVTLRMGLLAFHIKDFGCLLGQGCHHIYLPTL